MMTTILRDMFLGAVAAVVLLLLLVLRASITNPDAAWGILAAPIVALFGAALGLPIGLIIRNRHGILRWLTLLRDSAESPSR